MKYSLISYSNIGKFIRELCSSCELYERLDFDGDALNSLSLEDIELIEAYELFNPRTNMVISKNDGLFNNNFNLIKDQLICLHQFTKLGKNKKKVVKIMKSKRSKSKNLYIKSESDLYVNEIIEKQKRIIKLRKIK